MHSQSAQHSQIHELLPEMACASGFEDGGPVPTRGNYYHVLPYGEVLLDEGQAARKFYGLTEKNSCPSRRLAFRTLPQAKLSGFGNRG